MMDLGDGIKHLQ